MTEKYTLEFLSERFEDDILRSVKERLRLREEFRKHNPKEPLPEYMKDEFNVAIALKTIVDNLIALNNLEKQRWKK